MRVTAAITAAVQEEAVVLQQAEVSVPAVAQHDLLARDVSTTRAEDVLAGVLVPGPVAGPDCICFVFCIFIFFVFFFVGFDFAYAALERCSNDDVPVRRRRRRVVEHVTHRAQRAGGVERHVHGPAAHRAVRPPPRANGSPSICARHAERCEDSARATP